VHKISLDGNSLNPEQAMAVSSGNAKASLSDASRDAMEASRRVIEGIIDSDDVVYGINTGFGALSSVRIERSELEELQANLVRSHACGVGNLMRPEDVLLMMTYRANSLAKGVSGARPEIVDLILAMVNQGIAPVVPRIGSLGASGDLAPLSHMTMGMMGEGDCMKRTDSGWVKMSSADALSSSGLTPVILEAKEGLSLINGTSQMCAYLTVSLLNLEMLTMVADGCVACSVEAIKVHTPPLIIEYTLADRNTASLSQQLEYQDCY
jgi:histidine ammonia-lyase